MQAGDESRRLRTVFDARHLVDVDAGNKGVGPRPGENDGAQAIVVGELAHALDQLAHQRAVDRVEPIADDDRLRAVVLTGAGPKAFIAGVDINEMARIENGAQATAFITRLHQCCAAIRNVPVPVIARIQGYAFGGGLEIETESNIQGVPSSRPRHARGQARHSLGNESGAVADGWLAGLGRPGEESCIWAKTSPPPKLCDGAWWSMWCRRRPSMRRSKPGSPSC